MARQAADAAIAAYRAGVTRQSIRLRLDMVCKPERLTNSGMEALLEDALPLASQFTENLGLPGGAAMREVRVSRFDGVGLSSGDVGTLLYRISEDAGQDAAVVFLGGRNWAVEGSTQSFLAGMKTRLVVMLNAEDAASSFRIENKGEEFVWGGGGDKDKLTRFCQEFQEETYYYRLTSVDSKPVVVFRAYPHPWDVYVADASNQAVKLRDSPTKPSSEQIERWMRGAD